MQPLQFDNRFIRELPGDPDDAPRPRQVQHACWSRVLPTAVSAPRLIAHSREVAQLLGLSEADITSNDVASRDFAAVFGGNALMPGMQPYAACYGGHQFGHWAGQLGDGRAISLGETVNAQGERWELQLKGAGRTAYSRGADGRAVLRSSIREFLCSEAMFHLGVPTTRALSLVATGDQVPRDMFYDGNARREPGAIVCRVAPSFIRFGNFEILAARRDHELLEKLVDFTIARDFPALMQLDVSVEERRARWFEEICVRTAHMVNHWMRVGFVHGVMNTDNMSILGLTIDYGPYGFIDNFDPGFTPNTTDAEHRRYRFGRQPDVALWNLSCLAQALAPLFVSEVPLENALQKYGAVYIEESPKMLCAKLGLTRLDEHDDELVRDTLLLLHRAEVDMTLFFRGLADVNLNAPSLEPIENAFYRDELRVTHGPEINTWLTRYVTRASQEAQSADERRTRMKAVNPRYILRNYLAQEAIDLAEAGDESRIHTLLDVLRHPYDDDVRAIHESPQHFAEKRPDWARHKAGCSMLSCSS